ncbi:hypothetical protein [Nitrosopumilus sp.]|uniref:hypothetical protein n=1 Tax=Nitrosopumilus sp. TaxID=2024843 RepID=UPI0034A0896A
MNFAQPYDNNGMIIDDLQRIYDWCDYIGEKPVGILAGVTKLIILITNNVNGMDVMTVRLTFVVFA